MSGDENSILAVNSVSKCFRDALEHEVVVLKEISFSLPPKRIVGILGASGCGKTTLLRIIAGLDTPTTGEIVAVVERPGRKVGYMQQGERLLPWRNVRDNVALGLELGGIPRKSARESAEGMLSVVEMEECADLYPEKLSGGMTQRVLLARTLITHPTLLLFDEPLGQLDILGRRALASIIRDYIDRYNASALLVTHSVEEAVFVSDYILTLSRGPSRVINRFSLNGESMDDFDTIDRSSSFHTVLTSLLSAMDTKEKVL